MNKVILDIKDFKDLTAGRIVTKENTEIILLNIGWAQMLDIITGHVVGTEKLNGHEETF